MKKIFKLLLISAMMILSIGCFSATASAATKTSVKILKVGSSYTIKNTSKVKSSKSGVATAKKKSSTKYKITGKKKGATTLSVYNKKGKLSQKVYLLVYNDNTFKYNTTAINLAKGKTKTVTASTNKSGISIKYASSDKNIATVNSSGKISAKKAGKATISAKFYYKGTKVKTKKKTVNVYASSYNTDSITLTEGKTKTVSASISSNCTAKYSSSNTSVATVNSSGKITAKKKGTATITCKVYLGSTNVKTYTKKVTVNSASTSSSSSSSSFTNQVFTSSSTTIAGGKAVWFEVSCEKKTDVVTVVLQNDCVVVKELYEPEADKSYGTGGYIVSIDILGQKEGTCDVTFKVNGKTIKTKTVTVTSTNTDYTTYMEWKAKVQKQIWSSSMTNIEKVAALCDYVWNNYEYYTYAGTRYVFAQPDKYPGADCYGGADLIVDFVKDLGGTGTIELAYNASESSHVWANIKIDGETYYVDVWSSGTIYNSSKRIIYTSDNGWV